MSNVNEFFEDIYRKISIARTRKALLYLKRKMVRFARNNALTIESKRTYNRLSNAIKEKLNQV